MATTLLRNYNHNLLLFFFPESKITPFRKITPFPSLFFKPSSSFRPILSHSSSSSSSYSTKGTSTTNTIEKDHNGGSELQLYNTMSRSKQPFKPRVEGKVGMYVCGVTAYDLSYIGHARVYVTFDVLYRYLQHLKFEVFYVRNFTDVDDKIIARANELREDPLSLSNRFCNEFHADMAYLHCLPPSVEPRVSDHMNQIIDMIKQLDGDVYFSVDKIPAYGQLCGRKLEDNRAGERVAVDSRKQNPADFALWKVIDLYHPLALRLFLIGTHYRSPINYSNAQLEAASDRLYYIYQTLRDCEEILMENNGKILEDSAPLKDTLDCIAKFHSEFENSMSDDLHTPAALAALSEPLKSVNDLLHTRKGRKQLKRIESIFAIEKIVKNVLTILGLVPSSYNEVLQQLREKALKRAGLTEDQVLEKIEERNTQRKNKEFEKSDDIRKELAAVGIALMDSPQGTTWRPGIPLDLQEKIAST